MVRNRRGGGGNQKSGMVLAAVAGLLGYGALAQANVLFWDGNGAVGPNPAGGAGTWDLVNSNWWDGSANQTYGAGVTPHDTVFGVAGGAVSIAGAVTAKSLAFNVTGYSIGSGTLNLAGPGTIDVAGAASVATISAPVTSSGIIKTGAGILTLNSGVASSYAGATILGGTLSINATGHLGDANGVVTIDGGTLRMTGTTAVTSPNTRSFVLGSHGATIEVQNVTSGSNTGLTAAGQFSGPGQLLKTGVGTLRFDRASSTFTGGLNIAAGVVRFNNNNDAGPKTLRGNQITFGSNASTLSIGGSGSSTDASASELRTGEWVSAGGTGSILAATTTVGGFGASGHDLLVQALADGTFTGSVNNTITAGGGTAGTNSKNGNFTVRGIATQTLTGVTNINNAINVAEGAGLKLGGSATVTGGDVNLNLKGGTFTLDNSAVNNTDRYRDAGSIEPRGGGRLVFAGNAGGSTETMGTLQLGTHLIEPPKNRSGALSIDVVHTAGASAATVLNFEAIQRDSGRATVDFSAHNGGGSTLSLGQSGNNPRITFGTAPTLAVGSGLFESAMLPGDVGWATVNGSAFATYDTNGVVPVSTVNFASAGGSDNAQLSGSDTVPGSVTKTVASLAISPSAGQTLDLTGTANLATPAILLAGANDFEIRNSGGGTGGVSSAGNLYVHVPQATLKISTPVSGGALVKSGAGTLELAGTNTYSGSTTINGGAVRASAANLGAGAIEFRGGSLELTGGGTFSRNLGVNAGEINWTNTQEDRGGGGFAAIEAPVTIDLGSAGATDIYYEATNFVESGYALAFGSRSANAAVTWVDNLILNTLPTSYNAREIRVTDNPNSSADMARITGVISSDSAVNDGALSDLLKTGDGTLELAAANTYVGGTLIAEGTLLAGDSNALGGNSGAYVLLGNRGGSANAALLSSAPVTIARDITVQAGSAGTVSLGSVTADASTFSGTVHVYRALQVQSAGNVTLSGLLNNVAGATITKTGAGAATISGPQSHAAGAQLVVSQGTLNLNTDGGAALTVTTNSTTNFGATQHLAGVNVGTGGLAVLTAGANKVLVANAVTIAGGKLDLTDNKLITNNAAGTQTGGTYDDVQGLVQSGRNGGSWDGSGIVTSQSAAQGTLTTLGVSTGAIARFLGPTDTTTWAGQTINASSVMVMYTYTGDANLDGIIDGTDYFYIDSNVGTSADGYGNGDFNYDGIVDGTDYFYIDSNIVDQGPQFPTSGGAELLAGVQAVPEPASLSVIGLAATGLLAHRRRRA